MLSVWSRNINIWYEYTYEHNTLLLCSTCALQISLMQLLAFEEVWSEHKLEDEILDVHVYYIYNHIYYI